MRPFYTLAVLALAWLSGAVEPGKVGNAIYSNAQEAFRDLLDAIPEESLKTALSGLAGWKEGVFETQHRGVEHVHNSDPALATKIIVAAVHDLKKRQAGPANATSASPPPRTSSQRPLSQSSQAPALASSASETQNRQTSVVVVTLLTTTTNSRGQAVTATETRPTVVTDPATSAPATPQTLTTTNSQGSTFVTTITPSAAKVSSTSLITTTGPDGKPTTITTVLDSTATATPGLQNGASEPGNVLNIAAAACAGALALFL